MAENDLPPVSWASVIIGFISFAFTLSTFFKVIAGNLATLHAAPTEAPFYLSNIKQELFEERLHLRRARRRIERNMRRCRRQGIVMSSWDSGPAIRLLEATVRRLCREFRDLERPFLTDRNDRGVGGNTPNARNEKMHPNGDAGSPGSPVNLNTLEEGVRAREAEIWDDYIDAGFENDYGTVTFYHRFAWLERKNRILQLSHSLERLQVRRIGRETTDALNEIKQLKSDLQDLKLIPSDGGGRGGGDGDHGGGGHGATEKDLYSSRSTDRKSSRHGRTASGRRHGVGAGHYAGGSRVGGKGGPVHVRDRSLSISDSSDTSDDGRDGGVAREKTERVHVRRTRYHVQ